MTIIGEADTLKSFTIAIDGLNRNPEDSPDAYARVQIGRLRKAIKGFNAKYYVAGQDMIEIDLGSYGLSLITVIDRGGSSEGKATSKFINIIFSRMWLGVFTSIVVLFFAYLLYAQLIFSKDVSPWLVNDFPALAIEDPQDSLEGHGESLRINILNNLMLYEGLVIIEQASVSSDFSLSFSKLKNSEHFMRATLTHRRSGRFIWSADLSPEDRSEEALVALASVIAFQVGHTTGAIHSYNRRWSTAADSPYSCWLRFTALVETTSTIGDEELYNCAHNWHEAASQHPIAAMLRGWTLTDRAVTQLSDARHDELLQDAVDIFATAKILNPTSTGLHLATMRAQSFAGNHEFMKASGRAALNQNPQSPHVKALVGLTLALWNDAEGPILLRQALADHPSPPAWYHVGLVVDAVMRDNLEQETVELERVSPIRQGQPLIAILFAAHAAQLGEVEKGRRILNQPPFRTMFGGIAINRVMERLPVAPVVREKFSTLLRPVIES